MQEDQTYDTLTIAKLKRTNPTGAPAYYRFDGNGSFYSANLVSKPGNDAGIGSGIFTYSDGSSDFRYVVTNFRNPKVSGAFSPVYASDFVKSSSIRFKENIKNITDEEAAKILELNPVLFNYTWDEPNLIHSGFIAEDVLNKMPIVVRKDQDEEPNGISYEGIIPYLVKMIQMQQKEIEELKKGDSKND